MKQAQPVVARLRTPAFFLSLALVLAPLCSHAADDAPKIIKLETGDYLVNQQAFNALDKELVRLQEVERKHKDEEWATALLVAAGVGLAVGAATASAVILLAR